MHSLYPYHKDIISGRREAWVTMRHPIVCCIRQYCWAYTMNWQKLLPIYKTIKAPSAATYSWELAGTNGNLVNHWLFLYLLTTPFHNLQQLCKVIGPLVQKLIWVLPLGKSDNSSWPINLGIQCCCHYHVWHMLLCLHDAKHKWRRCTASCLHQVASGQFTTSSQLSQRGLSVVEMIRPSCCLAISQH